METKQWLRQLMLAPRVARAIEFGGVDSEKFSALISLHFSSEIIRESCQCGL